MDKLLHNQVFPQRVFFFFIALHSKNIWHQHVSHVKIFFCSQMYWVLETLQFQFWTKFNKPSPTRKFLNGGVALTGYSRIGTLKRMHNTTFLWEIENSNWKPSCLICWSSAYVHDVRYMIWGFQNADCLGCVIWQHTKKNWISIFFQRLIFFF